jgi:thioredoxin 1
MKRILSAFIIAGLSLLMIQCNRQSVSTPQASVKKTGIKFVENTTKEWEAVLAEAQASNKVIFVDVYASWCGPCKYMDKEVFTDERVASKFNKKFINYKVDGESFGGVNISLQYEVAAYPTYLFINGQGQLLHKIEGIRQAEQFIEEADMALTMK